MTDESSDAPTDGAPERQASRSASGRTLGPTTGEAGYGETQGPTDTAADVESAADRDQATTATGYGEVPGDRDVEHVAGSTPEGVPESYGEVPAPVEGEAPTAGGGVEDWRPEAYDADLGSETTD